VSRVLPRFLVSATALLVAAVAAEGLWRGLRAASLLPVSPLRTIADPDLGWRLAPGARIRHRSPEYDVTYRIDGRGERIVGGAAGGRPLALFVGDSLTFGWGVEGEETFAARAGAALGLRVADLGVPGYGTDQILLKLRRDGLPRRPALVVFAFCRNDLVEVLYGSRYGWPKPRFALRGGALVAAPPARGFFLQRHSYLLRSGSSLLQRRAGTAGAAARQAEAERLIRRLTAAMAAETAAAGGRFVLVVDGDGWLRPALAGAPGSLWVDARPRLAAAARGGPIGFRDDQHWTPRGHAAVAAALADALAPHPPP
jgi:lysophospholipase L1-like esterase